MFGLFAVKQSNRLFENVVLKKQVLTRNLTSGNGDIRGAGGSFGKKEKAQEEQYFRQKEKEELAQLKKKIDNKSTADKKEPSSDKSSSNKK